MLHDFDYVNEESLRLSLEFLENKKINRYVLGWNDWARSVVKLIELNGIIDDFTDSKYYDNLPVFKTSNIQPDNSIVLSAAMLRSKTALTKLKYYGIKCIDYYAFYRYSKLEGLLPPPFFPGFQEEYRKNFSKFQEIFDLLADEKSKKVLGDVLNFRITSDLKFLEDYNSNQDIQYFDSEIYELPSEIAFCDAGAYKGETTLNFIQRSKSYKKIYVIEPIREYLDVAKRNLERYSNIEWHCCALSNYEGTGSFCVKDDSSCFKSSSDYTVIVKKLDNIIHDEINLIKFDLEGAEQDAIEGASDIIRSFKPILAICVYHRPDDLYKVPLKILSINHDYKIYLRHYTEGVSETVMYFIPMI